MCIASPLEVLHDLLQMWHVNCWGWARTVGATGSWIWTIAGSDRETGSVRVDMCASYSLVALEGVYEDV